MITTKHLTGHGCLTIIPPLSSDSLGSDMSEDAEPGEALHPTQIPIADASNETLPLFYSVSSVVFDIDRQNLKFDVEPRIVDCKDGEHGKIFKIKCQQCTRVCDFTDSEQSEAIQNKTLVLEDILQAVSSKDVITKLCATDYEALYRCFERNVIRTTTDPPASWVSASFVNCATDRIEEVGWEHIRLFYKILTEFFRNSRFNAKWCLEKVAKLQREIVMMFRAPDERERKKVMKLFHAMYLVFGHLRTAGRRLYTMFLEEFAHSSVPHFGVQEVLDAICPIVCGFSVPLIDVNLTLFMRVILPLHQSKYVKFYHRSLTAVVVAFVKKQESLGLTTVRELVKCWPITNPVTQVLFIGELEKVSQVLSPEQNREFTEVFCKILGRSVNSVSYPIAERSLMLWDGPFARFIKHWAEIVLPILIPPLFMSCKSHWLEHIRVMAKKVLVILKTWNPEQFTNTGKQLKQCKYAELKREADICETWREIITSSEAPEHLTSARLHDLDRYYMTRRDLEKLKEMYPKMSEMDKIMEKTPIRLKSLEGMRSGSVYTPVPLRRRVRVTHSSSAVKLPNKIPVRSPSFRTTPKLPMPPV